MSELVTNKITPGTGSSDTVTLGDSGDTFSIPSGATIANSGTATGFLPAAGTSGNVLTSNGSSWASAAGGGAWEWVETIVPAAASNNLLVLDQNIATGYDYLITWQNIKTTTYDASLVMRLMYSDPGAEVTGSDYKGTGFYAYGSTIQAMTEATGEVHMHRQNQNGGGTAGDCKFGEMLIYNPAIATPTFMHGIGGEYNGSLFYTTLNSVVHNQNTAITGFKMKIDGDTFANQGQFITYRRKNT